MVASDLSETAVLGDPSVARDQSFFLFRDPPPFWSELNVFGLTCENIQLFPCIPLEKLDRSISPKNVGFSIGVSFEIELCPFRRIDIFFPLCNRPTFKAFSSYFPL